MKWILLASYAMVYFESYCYIIDTQRKWSLPNFKIWILFWFSLEAKYFCFTQTSTPSRNEAALCVDANFNGVIRSGSSDVAVSSKTFNWLLKEKEMQEKILIRFLRICVMTNEKNLDIVHRNHESKIIISTKCYANVLTCTTTSQKVQNYKYLKRTKHMFCQWTFKE